MTAIIFFFRAIPGNLCDVLGGVVVASLGHATGRISVRNSTVNIPSLLVFDESRGSHRGFFGNQIKRKFRFIYGRGGLGTRHVNFDLLFWNGRLNRIDRNAKIGVIHRTRECRSDIAGLRERWGRKEHRQQQGHHSYSVTFSRNRPKTFLRLPIFRQVWPSPRPRRRRGALSFPSLQRHFQFSEEPLMSPFGRGPF